MPRRTVSDHDVRLHIDRRGATVQGYLAAYEETEGYGPPRLLACPGEWEQLTSREQLFQCAENDRLLYVASTRARACLTIAQRETNNSQNPWCFFENHLAGCPAAPDPGIPAPQTVPETDITPQEPERAFAAIGERWDKLGRATYASQAIKEIALTSTLPQLERAYAASGEHGVEWGTLIHALLEAAVRFPSADLRALAHAVSRDQEIGTELLDTAVQTVQAVQQSDLWQRAQASSRRLVEVPIQFLVPGDQSTEGVPTVQRGVIDLLFLEPQGWVIADYKTDAVVSSDLPKLMDHSSSRSDMLPVFSICRRKSRLLCGSWLPRSVVSC
jgi:ATP-dependent helicase/nuclease subunit A